MVYEAQKNQSVSKRNIYLKWFLAFLVGSLIAIFSHWAKGDVLFEGYSKVLSGGAHVGYVISKYEYDNKKKIFTSTYFLKTNELAGNLSEGLKATATDDLKPLSYEYTTIVGKEVKTIDAKFEGGKILASIKKENGKIEKVVKDLPKGTFLSTFLAYTILRSPEGFKVDTRYDYQAVAEEDAAVVKGVAVINAQEDYNGFKVYKVLNEFKNTKFYSWVNERGEVLSTKSPAQGITTELVALPSVATNNITVPNDVLKTLFGEIPTGQRNAVSEKAKSGSAMQNQTNTPSVSKTPRNKGKSLKESGFPAGKGILIKGK